MRKKTIYSFGADRTEGNANLRGLLGGKGANLAEMADLGIPVPPGFTITTEACIDYLGSGEFPGDLWDEIAEQMKHLEGLTGAEFGGAENPLLVSVRSGAQASMPGMMDTVLNLGLSDRAVLALERKTGNPRFAYDSYRRFINMFGNVVLELNHHDFETLLDAMKKEAGGGDRLRPGAR